MFNFLCEIKILYYPTTDILHVDAQFIISEMTCHRKSCGPIQEDGRMVCVWVSATFQEGHFAVGMWWSSIMSITMTSDHTASNLQSITTTITHTVTNTSLICWLTAWWLIAKNQIIYTNITSIQWQSLTIIVKVPYLVLSAKTFCNALTVHKSHWNWIWRNTKPILTNFWDYVHYTTSYSL